MMAWERRVAIEAFSRVVLALFDIGEARGTQVAPLDREGLRALLDLAESELADRETVKP